MELFTFNEFLEITYVLLYKLLYLSHITLNQLTYYTVLVILLSGIVSEDEISFMKNGCKEVKGIKV